jgi:hypothetical protein
MIQCCVISLNFIRFKKGKTGLKKLFFPVFGPQPFIFIGLFCLQIVNMAPFPCWAGIWNGSIPRLSRTTDNCSDGMVF